MFVTYVTLTKLTNIFCSSSSVLTISSELRLERGTEHKWEGDKRKWSEEMEV